MSLFAELIDRHGGIDGEPSRMADTIAADLGLNPRQREALWPLILAECERIDRAGVRGIESDGVFEPVAELRRGAPARRPRAELLTETFPDYKGNRIAWGEATIADHQNRIDMLGRLAGGITATIDRHQQAVDAISAAGVTCLNDLAAVAA